MMRAIPLLTSLAIGSLSVLGVALADSKSDDANLASEQRSVGAFHAIELAGTLGVEVAIGSPASVKIVGEADLIGKVKTTVEDGTLVIDTPKQRWNTNRGSNHVKAVIVVPQIDSLKISGTGGIDAKAIANDKLTLDVSGTGGITVTGSTGRAHLVIGGTGSVEAKNLAAKEAVVDMSGTGGATIRVSDSLDAKISGVGSLDVHGHPQRVKKSVSGLGSIHIH